MLDMKIALPFNCSSLDMPQKFYLEVLFLHREMSTSTMFLMGFLIKALLCIVNFLGELGLE